MSRRRRAAVLSGLALLLGGLAAGDVARREAALREGVGPTVRILVAATDLRRGAPLRPGDLALRRVPARWAPAGAFTHPAEVGGLRVAADVPRGADITAATVAAPPADGAFALRDGERAVQVVAGAPPGAVRAGATVDVVVAREGPAEVVVRAAEVLSTAPAEGEAAGAPRLAVTLRTTLDQALLLAGAEAAARDVRLLPRPVDHPSSAP